jgi:zinc transporter ZupT
MIHACGEAECEAHLIGWPALIGIATESLVDGVAIAVGFAVDASLGLGIALAVFAHELPRGLTTAVIMRRAGYRSLATWGALLVDAGFTPLGALLGTAIPASALEVILGLTAGTFLYVGASDLLPDAHRRFNVWVVLATLAGAALIAGLGRLI